MRLRRWTASIDAIAETTDSAMKPESTITPYYTALNGVNGPTNMLCKDLLWLSMGIVALLILVVRISETAWAKRRQASAVSRPRAQRDEQEQACWKTPRWRWVPELKKHLLYAPLLKKRHNRAFRLSLGTLPTRLFMMLMVLYLASNVAYLLQLRLSNPNRYALLAELRGRSGTLAVANMVPLVIFAGRNNPLIPILNISFDSFNLLHRWLGRTVVAQVVIHAICWIVPVVADGGWSLVGKLITGTMFASSGTVGALAMLFLLLLSLSPARHAFYETFVNMHILLAATAFATTWIHCASAQVENGLPQLPWIMAIVYLWFAERLARVVRTLYVNWSGGVLTTAHCEALPGDVTRVTMQLPRHLNINPGTHAYLRFWGINAWESHPFSIAWVEHGDSQQLALTETETTLEKKAQVNGPTSVSFLVGAHAGVTRKLFNKASSCPPGVRVRATIEGPYSGHDNLDSYGHVVLFAGSTGVTHQLSYIKHLLEGHAAGTVATRRLVLYWVVRDLVSLEWVRPYMDTLLQIPLHQDLLRISVFATRTTRQHDMMDAIPNIKITPGRPDVSVLLADEVGEQIGAMCVSVCGAGGLADDVRGAVRAVQGPSVVDFIEESFTW